MDILKPRLLGINLPDQDHQKIVINSDQFRIGRNLQLELCLEHITISRLHCIFTKGDNGWSVTCKSDNGIKVNETRLYKDMESPVGHGDTIMLAEQEIFYWKFCLEGNKGGNEDDRKLFVGGLPQEAKDTNVKEYFGTFGEIENINLKTDPHTGRSRGFAFIVYKEAQGVVDATQNPAHVVKGKKVTCKKAEARPGKIFLGKVPDEVTEDDIKEHFANFGTVTELVRPIDKANNDKPKNFCFLTFDREEVAKKLVKEGECTIKGEKISIKRVTPKEGPGGFGARGGFGGGWGYGDPYAGYGGYGGYGGGYADPYAGYGYGGGYGGGWGGDFGAGGGKMARGGAPRGRGRGRGGRPY